MKALLLTLLLTLTGCENLGVVASKGAEISDAALEAALWEICQASPVGAVRRKFDTPEKAEQYRELCSDKSDFSP